MNITRLLNTPRIKWRKRIDRMPMAERDEVRRALERLALGATTLAAYVEERHGYGNGDQGHESAVKASNRAGQKLWCSVLRYNEYHSVNF